MDYEDLRYAWCFGSEEFRQELLAAFEDAAGPNHYGSERRESGEQIAERLIAGELVRLGRVEAELGRRAKGDPGKVQIARKVRQETTMTLAWIAGRLQMGSWTYVSNLLGAK